VNTNELIYWVFSASTVVAVVAGLLATRIRGEWLAVVPLAHAAGAAMVALFGWEVLVYLPGGVRAYFATVAGIPDAPAVADQQAFLVASIIFVVAAVLAVGGIVRRRPWAVVLGVGLAASRLAMSVASSFSLLSFADSFPPDEFAWQLGTLLALNAVPALVAIALLLWPFRRGSMTDPAPEDAVDWSGDPSPEAGR
jgi:hypothetical protein